MQWKSYADDEGYSNKRFIIINILYYKYALQSTFAYSKNSASQHSIFSRCITIVPSATPVMPTYCHFYD